MNAPAILFLFALLSTALGADDRLIPVDDFSISVPLTKGSNPKGMELEVWVQRPGEDGVDGAHTNVLCPAIPFFNTALQPDDQTAFWEACAAALSGKEYRKEIERKFDMREFDYKTVYEVVTVEGHKRVRIGRGRVGEGGDAFLDPDEGIKRG